MRSLLFAWFVLAGCKADDLISDLPDADVGADALALPAGYDWSCVGEAWPTDAPDVLEVQGRVLDAVTGSGIGGATVDILDAQTDAVKATGTSTTGVFSPGRYTIEVATDGTAPTVIRRATAFGRVDGYVVDPAPTSTRFREAVNLPSLTSEEYQGYYGITGDTPTTGRGLVMISIWDCADQPVEGATIDVPGAGDILYVTAEHTVGGDSEGLTATTTDGGAIARNVPPGTIDVTVTVGGYTYRSWPVHVFADAAVGAPRVP